MTGEIKRRKRKKERELTRAKVREAYECNDKKEQKAGKKKEKTNECRLIRVRNKRQVKSIKNARE